MTGEPLALHGCAPTPLASYLKALGVLRLISSPANHVSGEAADSYARGWWENECFHLRTTLSRNALLRFFLHDYAPSPIIAPWNGGSGFYAGDNKDGFAPLAENQVAGRFTHISAAIRKAARTVAGLDLAKRPEGAAKVELVAALRAELADTALLWLDAVLALSGGGLAYPELLGTGGNDGRLDFTNNFARRLVSPAKPAGLFDASSGEPSNYAAPLLEDSLLAAPVLGLCSAAIGQFAPGAAGGPNATNGYSADSEVNPWDFVLMLEGATAFAGAATRRHQSALTSGTTTRSGASFPFTVRAVGAGWGGVEAADENDARAEFWAPIWRRPARALEIDSLLGEGRAVLNEQTAKDGLDFARAAASLGVSRGFREFERFGFLMRAGRTYLATPIGRRSAAPSLGAQLVADLDVGGDWLDRVRRVGRNDEEPGAARRAIKRLEDALFGLLSATEAARGNQSGQSWLSDTSWAGSLSARAGGRRSARHRLYCRRPGPDEPTTGARSSASRPRSRQSGCQSWHVPRSSWTRRIRKLRDPAGTARTTSRRRYGRRQPPKARQAPRSRGAPTPRRRWPRTSRRSTSGPFSTGGTSAHAAHGTTPTRHLLSCGAPALSFRI